ncbi:MAG: flavodoxin family protein [Tannerellaceae bacterium]|nr:flavodoxin family protein [Tannerellaceae bacterium]
MVRRDALKSLLLIGGSVAWVGMKGSVLTNNKKNDCMKVLLVNGSPNKEGCTYTALQEISETLGKEGIGSEILYIASKPLSGCRGCGACRNTGRCVIDDIVNEVIDRLDEFDGFIFGSPVHYASASGFITPFLDRLFYAASHKMAYKPGAAIVSCRRAGSTAALDQLNKYFTISNMPVVSSQYWNMVHGFSPDDVRKDKEGLQIMRTLARNMAWLLHCIQAGKTAGINRPQPEPRVVTNFID